MGRKQCIARAAINEIQDGDSVIFDAGSTVMQMIPFLSQFSNITVMTNSLHIVNALVELDNDQTILMPGGTYRKKSSSFHGSLAENAFNKFNFDKLFIGADGVDLNGVVTTFNEVHGVSQAMCKAVERIFLLVDSSKFGRKSPNVVCQLDKVDTLIMDTGLGYQYRDAIEKFGIRIILVGEDDQ